MNRHELKKEIATRGILEFEIELNLFEIGFMNDKFFVFQNGKLIHTTKVISKKIKEILEH